jgi:inhibitor of cysteine peptidase
MISCQLCRFGFGILIVFGLCLTISARAQDKDKKETVVTEKEDKSTVKIAKGTDLVIKLEGQPSTGFTWLVAKNNAEVLTYSGKPEIEKPKQPVIGGKVKMGFRFATKAVGVSEVELNYRRPFEKDTPPAKTFKVKIEVTD